MITGVVGVIIWTNQMDEMFTFYKDTLGLNTHSEKPDFVSFKFGDIRLGLGIHSKVQGKTQETHRIMINLGVDDIWKEHKRLVSKGVKFMRKPEKEDWGGWVATLNDPNGNTLQLMQLYD